MPRHKIHYKKMLKALLSTGYFPQELPPVFTTRDFGSFSTEIIDEWEKTNVFFTDRKSFKIRKKVVRGALTYKFDDTESEMLSKPKRGYERRTIQVVHPIPQALLSRELTRNWLTVQKWLSIRRYSSDEIRISDEFDRSIKGINFPLHREKKRYIEAGSDWVVRTDITRFYPSIYTHSIAWAAYGKSRVKNNLTAYRGSLADRIDTLVRACNRNQTIGIPIGPESSRIIAEIISARLDADFSRGNPSVLESKIDRLQDDWTVGATSLHESEAIIARISSIYRAYGLDINGNKTSINRIVSDQSEEWLSELSSFLAHGTRALSGARMREFLTLCLRMQSRFEAEPVINYALSVIESLQVMRSDVREVESFLLKAAAVAPNSLDRICRIILDIDHTTESISKERVASRFVELIKLNSQKDHSFEVIWLLYTLRGLSYKFVCREICEMSESMASSTIILLLLDMQSRGTLIGTLPKSTWENAFSEEGIRRDWTWLLAYEGFRHGWLKDKNGLLSKPFFSSMNQRDVVFYDPRRNVMRSKTVSMAKRSLRLKQWIEVNRFFSDLRGGDY